VLADSMGRSSTGGGTRKPAVCSASWASSTSPFRNIRSVERGRDAIESHDEEPPRLIGGE